MMNDEFDSRNPSPQFIIHHLSFIVYGTVFVASLETMAAGVRTVICSTVPDGGATAAGIFAVMKSLASNEDAKMLMARLAARTSMVPLAGKFAPKIVSSSTPEAFLLIFTE